MRKQSPSPIPFLHYIYIRILLSPWKPACPNGKRPEKLGPYFSIAYIYMGISCDSVRSADVVCAHFAAMATPSKNPFPHRAFLVPSRFPVFPPFLAPKIFSGKYEGDYVLLYIHIESPFENPTPGWHIYSVYNTYITNNKCTCANVKNPPPRGEIIREKLY